MNVETSTKIPVEMATTDQLMNVIKRINPFEATFREANKALKRGEYSQALSSVPRTIVVDEPRFDYAKPNRGPAATADIGQLQQRSMSPIQVQRYLSLKLPEIPLLSSNIGLQTPDIANFVSQVAKDGSPTRSAPQTADVLKTVLDMRETVESERNRDKSDNRYNRMSSSETNSGKISWRSNDRYSRDNDMDGIKRMTPVSEEDTRNFIEISSPSWQTIDNGNQQSPARVVGNHSNSDSLSDESRSDGEQNNLYISVKVGGQSLCIPMKINVNDKLSQSSMSSFKPVTAPITSGISRSFSFSAEKPSADIKSAYILSPHETPHGYLPTPTPTDVKLPRMDVLDPICSPMGMNGEDDKKKETLERNKEAAWRYRKRKKEEKSLLETRVKILENEKLELSTQVQVLKAELCRMNKILDDHKTCTAAKPFNEQQNDRPPPMKLAKLRTNVDDFSNSLLTNVSCLARSPNILQYFAVPTLQDQVDTPTIFRPVVLPSGQLVIPSSPQIPYVYSGFKLNGNPIDI